MCVQQEHKLRSKNTNPEIKKKKKKQNNLDMSSSSTRTQKATNLDFKYKNTCPDFQVFSYPFLSTKHKNTNQSPARTQTQT